MAFHQIQCPHCFTDYTISDEQYRNTEGVVRCGTCREQFKAILITEGGTPPKFDPRDVFIEPLSEPLPAAEGGDKKLSGEPDASYVSYEKAPETDEQSNIELMSTHEFEYSGPAEPPVPDELAEAYGNSDELSTSQILRNLRERQGETAEPTTATDDKGQLDLPIEEQTETAVDTQQSGLNRVPRQTQPQRDEAKLIDEVDLLVQKKLGTAATKADDLFLEPRARKKSTKNRFWGVIKAVFWVLIALILVAGLIYQLWLKQFIKLPLDHPVAQRIIQTSTPAIERAEKELAEYDLSIPQPRNLSKLELVSAQTEPHPTRSTTILLKVSIINHADIAQPLPWLEMTLTDASGRLVSRRNLSPRDYIYNNRTSSLMGPNELKKVTIELLSFPKSATGYEVKLLNK